MTARASSLTSSRRTLKGSGARAGPDGSPARASSLSLSLSGEPPSLLELRQDDPDRLRREEHDDRGGRGGQQVGEAAAEPDGPDEIMHPDEQDEGDVAVGGDRLPGDELTQERAADAVRQPVQQPLDPRPQFDEEDRQHDGDGEEDDVGERRVQAVGQAQALGPARAAPIHRP